jgi:hypothetical protein
MVFRFVFYNFALVLALSSMDHFALADDSDKNSAHEQLVKEAEETIEKNEVKVGMPQQKVMEILGDKYTDAKPQKPAENEKVLIWQKDKNNSTTVTFVDGKVKAVAHSISKPEEEDDD